MTARRSRLWLVLVGLAVVVGLPVAGWWARRGGPERCAFDGLDLEPRYRVRVVDRAGGSYHFCCTRCAERWLARRREPPAAVFVTDEESGEELPAAAAHYARSPVVTNRVTGDRVHAFRDRAAAEAHVAQFGGRLLDGDERPFRAAPSPQP